MSAAEIGIIVGTVSSIIGMIAVLWKIAGSVTTTQLSVKNIDLKITEINANLQNYDKRIGIVEVRSLFSERDLLTAFKKIDECKDEAEKTTVEAKEYLEKAIQEIKDNCREIQAEKRRIAKEKLG
jgi:TfoX/Sxy family transcriptional regulator of competence genes